MTRQHNDDALSGLAPAGGRRSGDYGSLQRSDAAAVTAATARPTKQNTRVLAPDLLRGLLMLIMALDHTALALNTWEHGTGRTSEMDGVVVSRWNRTVAVVVRSLTHLCAPGFTFLLGVGVVYLGRSRSLLGWSSWRIAKYFAVRGLVLTLINVVIGLMFSGGQIWLLNFVLFSLAVDYFLAGMLWLVINKTEPLLAEGISGFLEDDGAKVDEDLEEPLLRPAGEVQELGLSARATNWSWHIHNAILAVLSVVTIWWNIWLSPDHGECRVQSKHPIGIREFATTDGPPMPEAPPCLPTLWGFGFGSP